MGSFAIFAAGVVIAWVLIMLRVVPRPQGEDHDPEMELVEHLEELRARLIRSLLYLTIGTIVAWFCYDFIYAALTRPITSVLGPRGAKLTFFTFTEPFFLRFQVCLICGLILGGPPILMELWGFIAPALTPQERKPVRLIVPLAACLFVLGVALSYYILPAGLRWFLSYMPPDVALVQRLSDYLLFMMKMCLGFGIGFELPVLLMLLAMIGLINSQAMSRYWRHAVILIMLAAAILTPSNDPFSMMVMATPMAFLYLGSISLVKMVEPREDSIQRRRWRLRRRAPANPPAETVPAGIATDAGSNGQHTDDLSE
jgi:sec-independent protein translocase protein TatC